MVGLTRPSPIEAGKRAAAYAAVDRFVKDGMVVGIGSGSTIVYAVQRLQERAKTEELKITCIPTSFQAQKLITEAHLTLGTLNQFPTIDLAIDGADEVDPELNAIKGGGAAMLQEKLVARAAKDFVMVADFRKNSEQLGTVWTSGVPLEVIPSAYRFVELQLQRRLSAQPTLRMATAKAGPVVTDNGNFVLDTVFGPIEPGKVQELDTAIRAIPGIVETGLFVAENAVAALFGQEDGTVVTVERQAKA